MKPGREKKKINGKKKKKRNQNKPLASVQGSFFEVPALGDKSLSHSAQLDSIESQTFAADFPQRESLSLTCALSPQNSKQQNNPALESLQGLEIHPLTAGFTFHPYTNKSTAERIGGDKDLAKH